MQQVYEEGFKEGSGSDRKVRRKGPGRVKEIVLTLEEGAKQSNKISSYFSKFGEGRKNLEFLIGQTLVYIEQL